MRLGQGRWYQILKLARKTAHSLTRDYEKADDDADESKLAEPERAYVYLTSLGLSPSAWHSRHERMRRQMELTSSMLVSLGQTDRRLVAPSLQGVPSAEIAEERGYASADVVRQKRHRIYARLRRDFSEQRSESLFE